MMRKNVRKNNRSGFSLTETLFAVLIVLMVSSVVAAGIPTAARALKSVVDSSHAQVLLSTTMTALRDELSMADKIEWDPNGKIIKYKDSSNVPSKLLIKNDGIFLSKDSDLQNSENSSSQSTNSSLVRERRLVSTQAATDGLYETFSSMTYNAATGIISIDGLKVIRKVGSDTQVLAQLENVAFEIEVIARKG